MQIEKLPMPKTNNPHPEKLNIGKIYLRGFGLRTLALVCPLEKVGFESKGGLKELLPLISEAATFSGTIRFLSYLT